MPDAAGKKTAVDLRMEQAGYVLYTYVRSMLGFPDINDDNVISRLRANNIDFRIESDPDNPAFPGTSDTRKNPLYVPAAQFELVKRIFEKTPV